MLAGLNELYRWTALDPNDRAPLERIENVAPALVHATLDDAFDWPGTE
jgi:hypothetical protein